MPAHGFTLTELIVAIVVLGLLAALAIPAGQAVIDRSHDEVARVELAAIAREAAAVAALDGSRSQLTVDDVEAGTAGANATAGELLLVAATEDPNAGRSRYVDTTEAQQREAGHRSDLVLLAPGVSSEAHGYVSYALSSDAMRVMLAQRSRSGRCAVVWGEVSGALVEDVLDAEAGGCVADVDAADDPGGGTGTGAGGGGEEPPALIAHPDPDPAGPVIDDDGDPDTDDGVDPTFPDPEVLAPISVDDPNPALAAVKWVTTDSAGNHYVAVSDTDAGMLYSLRINTDGTVVAVAQTSAHGAVVDLARGQAPGTGGDGAGGYSYNALFALTEAGTVEALDPITLAHRSTVVSGLSSPTALHNYDPIITTTSPFSRQYRLAVADATGVRLFDKADGTQVADLGGPTDATTLAATYGASLNVLELHAAGPSGVSIAAVDFTDGSTTAAWSTSTTTATSAMVLSFPGQFAASATTLRVDGTSLATTVDDGTAIGGAFSAVSDVAYGRDPSGEDGAYVTDQTTGCLFFVEEVTGERQTLWCGSMDVVSFEPWEISLLGGTPGATGATDGPANTGTLAPYTLHTERNGLLWFQQGTTLRTFDPDNGTLATERSLSPPSYTSYTGMGFAGGELYVLGRSCYYSCSPYSLYRIASDGTYSNVMSAVTSTGNVFFTYNSTPYALTTAGELLRLDPTSGTTTTVATGLVAPNGSTSALIDANGPTVVYRATDGIRSLDPISGSSNLLHPTTFNQLTSDASGGVYVINGDRVQRINGDGTLINLAGVQWGPYARDGVATDGWFSDPSSIHHVGGVLFVNDGNTLRVLTRPATFDATAPAIPTGATDAGVAESVLLAGTPGTPGSADGGPNVGTLNGVRAHTTVGGLIWVLDDGNRLRTIDPASGMVTTQVTLQVPSYTSVDGMAFSGGKLYLSAQSCYYSCSPGQLYQVDLATGQMARVSAEAGSARGHLIARGQHLYHFAGSTVTKIDASSATTAQHMTLSGAVTEVVAHPDGALVVIGGALQEVDLDQRSATVLVGSGVTAAATGTGGEIYAASSSRVWRVRGDGSLEPMAGTASANAAYRLGVGTDAQFDAIDTLWSIDERVIAFDRDDHVALALDAPATFDTATQTTAGVSVGGPAQVTTIAGDGTNGTGTGQASQVSGKAVHDGELWTIAGNGQIRAFDPTGGTWRTLASVAFSGNYADLAWLGGDLYTTSRHCYYSCSPTRVMRVNPDTGDAVIVDQFSGGSDDGHLVAWDGALYVATNGAVHRLEVATGEHEQIASGLGSPISDFELISSSGRALVEGTNLHVVELSDGSTNSLGSSWYHVAAGIGGGAYVSDNLQLFELDVTDGSTTPLAGTRDNSFSSDGVGTDANFDDVQDLSVIDGRLLVQDAWRVKQVTGPAAFSFTAAPAGDAAVSSGATVATVAGIAGSSGSADGALGTSTLQSGSSVVADDGLVWMIDATQDLRTFDPGSGQVVTVVDSYGLSYTTFHDLARYNDETYAVTRSCYFSCGEYLLRRLQAKGSTPTVVAGLASAHVAAAGGSLWSANGSVLMQIDPATGAKTTTPFTHGTVTDMARSGDDVLVVAGGDVLRVDTTTLAVTPVASGSFTEVHGTDGGEVYATTDRAVYRLDGGSVLVAGSTSATGSADGVGSAARFYGPSGLTTLGGSLYVADDQNRTLRKID